MDFGHTVFICHVGDADDAVHRAALERRLGSALLAGTPEEPGEGDVDLHDAEVVLVLVGQDTWRSARVDAELAEATRGDLARAGVLAIILPSYDYPGMSRRAGFTEEDLRATLPRGGHYWAHSIPPRLFDQVKAGLAQVRPFPDRDDLLAEWIHEAAVARLHHKPAPARAALDQDVARNAVGWKGEAPRGLLHGTGVVVER